MGDPWQQPNALMGFPSTSTIMYFKVISYIAWLKRFVLYVMTSSNRNIFRVTGPLCGDFTGPGEFPAQRPVTRALMFSLICPRMNDWVNSREAGDLRHHRGHYDVIVMIFKLMLFATCCLATITVSWFLIPAFTVPMPSLLASFMGPTWGLSGADRTQVGPMLAPWTLLSRNCT